jgi:hypothetical protein
MLLFTPNTLCRVYIYKQYCLLSCMTVKYLTLREEHKLNVFQNRILREVFGSKRNEN